MNQALGKYHDKIDLLSKFIKDEYETGKDYHVHASSFKNSFMSAYEKKITQDELEDKMESRGFKFGFKIIDGKRVKVFHGLRFIEQSSHNNMN